MNYVPFGEKALSMVVFLYQKTAHEKAVLESNVLFKIIKVFKCFILFLYLKLQINIF